MLRTVGGLGLCLLLVGAAGCVPELETGWRFILQDQPGALLSVTGSAGDDIWIVGSDDGEGPTILHYDGTQFTRHHTGDEGDLWWIGRSPSGTLWTAGDAGRVFKKTGSGDFEPLPTPEPVRLFGVLPFADDDVWAVGGDELTGQSVVWHYDGSAWTQPADLDPALLERRIIFKIWGTSSDDVWLVGEGGPVLHKIADGWETIPVPNNGRLITVHGSGDTVISVGGFYDGFIVELAPGTCTEVTPDDLYQLNGVFVSDDGSAHAAGNDGAIWERTPAGEWSQLEEPPATDLDYHAIFQDPEGGFWAVGGFLSGYPLEQGVLTYQGERLQGEAVLVE